MTTDFPCTLWRGSLLLSLVLLSACAGPQTPLKSEVSPQAQVQALDDEYLALQSSKGGQLQAVDAKGSQVRILVFRGGKAPQVGHNHVLTVPALKGWLWTPQKGLSGARFALEFRLDQLLIDAPEQRAALGPGWASTLSPEDVASTREHMLGADNLQAEAFPWVRLRSVQIAGEAPALAAEIEIELHGQRERQWVALHAEPSAQGWRVRGSLVVRQSDYGVRPYSVLGGLLAVQDELVIDFAVQTRMHAQAH
ncbi:MAG TPA: YceI family protein [Burkholderiaceae bacterium]|jgi:hypothetical protein